MGLGVAAIALVAIAATLVIVGLNAQKSAPQPPAIAATPLTVTPARQPVPTAVPTPTATPAVAAPGLPLRLTIPAIKVTSTLTKLGRNRDGTVQVPPLNDVKQAGWYKYSPVPGDTGPAIILGHIDSAQAGNGVFFNLGSLRQGDRVTVSRTDHLLETFTITRVIQTAKTAFPASEVYGNTVDPELRLITCGGRFDPTARSYEDNIIVFAALTSTRKST